MSEEEIKILNRVAKSTIVYTKPEEDNFISNNIPFINKLIEDGYLMRTGLPPFKNKGGKQYSNKEFVELTPKGKELFSSHINKNK